MPEHWLGQRQSHQRFISAALLLVGGIGGCVGVVFAVVAPFVTPDFQALRVNIEDIVLFASGVGLTAITFVLDQALIRLMRGDLQFWRNTLFATAKLAALFAASLLSHAGLTIYMTWALGNVLSLAVLAGLVVLKRGGFRSVCWPEWGLLQKLGSPVLRHHMFDVTLQAPTLALPVLVRVLFSVTTNTWFYVSWMVAGFSLSFQSPSQLYCIQRFQDSQLHW
jgi:hypothetical protein